MEITNYPAIFVSLARNIERGKIRVLGIQQENVSRKENVTDLIIRIQGTPSITLEDLADMMKRISTPEQADIGG